MDLVPRFTQNDIRNFIRKRVEVVDKVLLDQLQQVGEQFVADARSTDTYTDRTGNLRSSVGYVIVKDGKPVFGNFEGTSTPGVDKARNFAEGIVAEYPNGYALIVVAGMNYALYVEAKGFDVLTGSGQTAASNLKTAFARVAASLKKRK